jgi:hypothetical protein
VGVLPSRAVGVSARGGGILIRPCRFGVFHLESYARSLLDLRSLYATRTL